ncbi:ATP-binding protein [Actinoplanes sp. NBRC 101535]|uniref:sensor histidine kinase n=1 Tax=Actinoplanes sp. NBRC 101535 TaxID=3032196 RepID=UPI00249FEA73|nr:ATP-binding protein [Actinoplanes sp. NBRC 101535]GLY00354.1 hypothetical protein Acsp01_07330 [Actinoplanes sp. NBRC 101535]
MSFRLRIFLLVLVVATTAIGATAWLTLSLTSREVTRVDQARERHEAEILNGIRDFGTRNGRWNGLDTVVAGLSARTGLHIRVVAEDSEVLADSDNLEKRAAGPVQLLPRRVDPAPALDGWIWEDAITRSQAALQRILDNPRPTTKPTSKEAQRKTQLAAMPSLPKDLFAAAPRTGEFTDPGARALFQAAQYKAALVAIRCAQDNGLTGDAALGLDVPPYLSDTQRGDAGPCLARASSSVRADRAFLRTAWLQVAGCTFGAVAYGECLNSGFSQATAATSAVPVEIYFGSRQETDFTDLGRPAVLGAIGLVAVAFLGTAWIARRVSQPLRVLTQASLQLAAGRLEVRVPARGDGDVARLSASFNAMAEALQRSEERQQRLIADVAHELRTPLSNLRGYLEGLADGVIEPSPELFASLHEETLLQRRILDDLQVLAQAEAGDLGYSPELLDLSDMVATTATAHGAVADTAGIRLTVHAPEPVEVYADPGRLRQVFSNLLSNAIRYTDAGGQVEMTVHREGPDAVVTVRDTGVGMTGDELARAFDRFWRADPARQRATGGSGLGLTIARRIIADQGGTLDAVSTPGVGTTFTARLPTITKLPEQAR